MRKSEFYRTPRTSWEHLPGCPRERLRTDSWQCFIEAHSYGVKYLRVILHMCCEFTCLGFADTTVTGNCGRMKKICLSIHYYHLQNAARADSISCSVCSLLASLAFSSSIFRQLLRVLLINIPKIAACHCVGSWPRRRGRDSFHPSSDHPRPPTPGLSDSMDRSRTGPRGGVVCINGRHALPVRG
jgi:hypothetical protein